MWKMNITRASLCGLVMWLGFSVAIPQTAAKIELPVKANFHLFLLAGQSNMAGRGDVEAEDKQPHARVLMLAKDGTWQPAVDPVHYDKANAGVGPGRTFGIALAEADTNITIGLIPAACGGSPISTWEPGAYFADTKSPPYDDAIQRAKLAMKDGTLKGIHFVASGRKRLDGGSGSGLQGETRSCHCTVPQRFGESQSPVHYRSTGTV